LCRAVVKAAGIHGTWTPRELRHTGVSLLFLGGVPIEEISRIAGCTTEIVYRYELRPIITIGATALDAPPHPLRLTRRHDRPTLARLTEWPDEKCA
jgi:hypothetical protein